MINQQAPSAHDEFVHFIHKPCSTVYLCHYQSPNQRWSHFARGCTVCGVSWVQSMQTICYPALRADDCTNKKAVYNCIRVAPPENPQRPERMCNGFLLLCATTTAPVYQTVDGRCNNLAESTGIEPVRPFRDGGLASRCITTLPTFLVWRARKDSNPRPTV